MKNKNVIFFYIFYFKSLYFLLFLLLLFLPLPSEAHSLVITVWIHVNHLFSSV